MWEGALRQLGILMGCGLAAWGCSSSDGPNCGTSSAPDVLTLSDVQPALGSSVVNSAIVQSFKIVGRHLQLTPSFGLAATHTAGITTPNPVHWTITLAGADTQYTSEPITWATAPGHVELDPPGLLDDTSSGCILALPTPTFSYEVTAP